MGDVAGADGDDACLGEWRGRGKSIRIHRGPDGLLVDMGSRGPSLVLLAGGARWPRRWAVVRAGSSEAQGTVYVFELQSAASSIMYVRKPSGDSVVEFVRVDPGSELPVGPSQGFEREVRRARPGGISFADALARMVSEKRVASTERERLAAQWLDYESALLQRGLALFKSRCVLAAQMQKCSATVSFEQLSKEIDGFPKRALRGSTYYVGDWGEGMSAECWFYATRGVQSNLAEGAPILFAEVLQGMLGKFLDLVRALGFVACSHEAGTWKIHVSWPRPEDEDDMDRSS
mmetsp:Transcript_88241/g.246887  ORF Transcript_88241/g.246887 Transcript_88241/m.246887 type:complete len:290 (-) Transcript_88241:77-946(-)